MNIFQITKILFLYNIIVMYVWSIVYKFGHDLKKIKICRKTFKHATDLQNIRCENSFKEFYLTLESKRL